MSFSTTKFEAVDDPALTCETAKDDYLFAMEPFVLEFNTYGSQCSEGALPETESCLDLTEEGEELLNAYYDVVSSYADLGAEIDVAAATEGCEDDSDPDCAAQLAFDLLSDAAGLCNSAFDDDCITARDGVWFTWTLACNAFDVYRSTCDDEGISVSTADFCAEDGNDIYDNCQQASDQLEFCGVGDFATPEEAVLALNLEEVREYINQVSHPAQYTDAGPLNVASGPNSNLAASFDEAVNGGAQGVVVVGLVVGMFAGLFAGYKSGQRRTYVPI